MPNSGNIATISGNNITNSGIDLSTKADLVGGKIPSSQLPSYVDDVQEYANLAAFPATGETGVIYVALDTNKIYRWSGSIYVEISSGATWGGITGTLSNQTDLQNALNAKEPTISAGTTAQYYRGDKTFQTLNTAAVAESVTSLYYTDARARAAISSSATGLTYTSGTGVFSLTANYVIPTTTEQTNWGSAYTHSTTTTGSVHGSTTVGGNLLRLTNPSAITFIRINADNTVSTLDAATFRTAIGAGTSSTVGTVTSISGTGTVSGLSLSGTVTTSGNITLGGTLTLTAAQVNAVGGITNNTTGTAGSLSTVLSSTLGGAGSVSGILKANGSGVVSAAVNNTDYTLLNGTGFVRMSGTTPSYVTGTSSQFLKADGSLDGTPYATTGALSGYLPLSGGTLTGALSGTSATFSSTLTASKGTFNGTTSEPIRIERVVSGTTVGRYSLAISGAGNFSLYDATADADRLIIASTGAATFTNSVTSNTSFQITPTTNTSNALYRATNAGGTAYIGLDSSSGGLTAAYALNIYHSGNYPIIFSTNGGKQRMRIAANGNVGINWSSPSYLLDARQVTSNPIANFGYSQIGASNSNGLIRVQSGTIPQSGGDLSGESGIIFAHSGGTGGVNFDANGGYIKSIRTSNHATTSDANSALVFATTAANTNTERMRITSGGNVLIKTTTDNGTDALQVDGSGLFRGNVRVDAENTYIGIDADAATVPRLGFVKKSGAQPFLGFAARPFTIKVSSGSTIDASNTFTTALTIATTGSATFSSSVTASEGLFGGAVTNGTDKLRVSGNTSTSQLITGSFNPNMILRNTATTLSSLYTTVIAQGGSNYTYTLDAASGHNRIYIIRAYGSGSSITLNRSGSDVIVDNAGNNQTSLTITPSGGAVWVQSNGSDAYIQLK